ncbi:MAG: response regulator [Nitrospiraceae bacterium]|nr:response regulator [Nitrospiraceae bacterium]
MKDAGGCDSFTGKVPSGPDAGARAGGDHLLSLFDNMLEGIALHRLVFDDEGRAVDYEIVDVNPRFEKMLGVHRDSLVGRSALSVYGTKEAPWLKEYADVALSGCPFRFETCSEATGRNFEISVIPWHVKGFATIYTDVTERRRVEATLKESGARYRTLVDTLPLGITIIDRDHRVVVANTTQAGLFRKTCEELIGKNCFREFEKRDAVCPHCPGVTCMETGRPACIETEGVRDDGSRLSVRITAIPLNSDEGGFSGFMEVVEDITEQRKAEADRKKFEARLLHAQKLESLGVLVGGIAHDFNNILTAILGHAELALLRMSAVSPGRENIREIEGAASRAADLARQMLAYSGKGRFVVETLDLNAIIAEMTHMLEVSISKNAVLRFDLHKGLPPVDCDATQLRQVIMNLVINASDAIGSRSGTIAITTGAADCDRAYLAETWLDEHLEEGLYVYLEIADTGCGIGKDELAKIFDPFFTTKFTGRGLGLAAVLGIIRGHRGAIKVQSEPGKGSIFKVLLPASADRGGCMNKESVVVERIGAGRTVLLVDDEETVRAIGRQMLEELGFRTLIARDGREALELFGARSGEISCVMLDLTMPHMDGEEAFRELKRISPDVKVIMSSGYDEQDVTQRFVGKGLAGFIQKPYKLAELGAVLMNILHAAEE